jgi:hypothetical protein
MTPTPLEELIAAARRGGIDEATLNAAVDDLTVPRLTVDWDEHGATARFSLGGRTYTGRAVLPPGVTGPDDQQRRRVELGALRTLREQIVPPPARPGR